MRQPPDNSSNILCVASFFKGNDFIRECGRQGGRVILLSREKLLGEYARRFAQDFAAAAPPEERPDQHL